MISLKYFLSSLKLLLQAMVTYVLHVCHVNAS